MDILLVAFQILFFVPVLMRLARGRPGHAAGPRGLRREIAAAARMPPLVLHAAALLLLWAGLACALARGEVSRAVSPRGAAGALVVLAGIGLMAWSLAVLRSWRLLPHPGPDHVLCTSGPYALVRHPMYLALDLLGVGTALWTGNPVVGVAAAFLILGGDLRARLEEKALLETFGEAYRTYMKRVRRTLPGIY